MKPSDDIALSSSEYHRSVKAGSGTFEVPKGRSTKFCISLFSRWINHAKNSILKNNGFISASFSDIPRTSIYGRAAYPKDRFRVACSGQPSPVWLPRSSVIRVVVTDSGTSYRTSRRPSLSVRPFRILFPVGVEPRTRDNYSICNKVVPSKIALSYFSRTTEWDSKDETRQIDLRQYRSYRYDTNLSDGPSRSRNVSGYEFI